MGQTALKPTKVTIGSNIKFFTREGGTSDGSDISIEFDIPNGMDRKELKKAILIEKENLDILVLVAERLKGTIPDQVWKQRRDLLRKGYDQILSRKDELSTEEVKDE